MTPFVGRVDDFQGYDDGAPGRLPPELFQADEGGDLSGRGAWSCRRGQIKLAFEVGTGPIRTLFAFRTPPGGLGFIVIDENGVFRGFPYVTNSGAPIPSSVPADYSAGPPRRPMRFGRYLGGVVA